ncbi:MAG: recombination regulator RecX [Ruminococcus sp.]|nr:recombination regulator RecX [Ruminococcus sp.]MCD7800994.1 recombination regulator RecX [Ruminococcus sp.]
MLIYSIVKYKGNTYEISLGNDEKVYINGEIILQYGLKTNMEISVERLNEVIHADTFRKAKERALYLLDYKDYSYVQLYEKLEANYPQDICLEVLSNLVNIGIIDDNRYAKNLAERLILGKKYGSYRAIKELKLKGIDDDLAQEIVSKYEDTELERLESLINGKYARYLNDDKGINKVKNALVRLGYSYDIINQVLD